MLVRQLEKKGGRALVRSWATPSVSMVMKELSLQVNISVLVESSHLHPGGLVVSGAFRIYLGKCQRNVTTFLTGRFLANNLALPGKHGLEITNEFLINYDVNFSLECDIKLAKQTTEPFQMLF